jgi:hypothetical protein
MHGAMGQPNIFRIHPHGLLRDAALDARQDYDYGMPIGTVGRIVKVLIGSAAVSLTFTLLTAALTTYGVVNVHAARLMLVLAGLVMIGAITTSDYLCDKSWKHALTVFLFSVVLVSSGLFLLDRWAIRKKAELDARSIPPPLSKALATPPTPPAIAFVKTLKPPPTRNVVTGNQNVTGNTVTQGPGSIAQLGGSGNTATVYNTPPQRMLTQEQYRNWVKLLKDAGVFKVVVRHAMHNFEAERYYDYFDKALREAGWDVVDETNARLIPEYRQGQGLQLWVQDTNKPPISALVLQKSLKQVGIDTSGVSMRDFGESDVLLYVGVQ